MEQILYLIRGLPGSGKSTIAKSMLSSGKAQSHYEADQYFMCNGEYVWSPAALNTAHHWCEMKTELALSLGKSVVVANTFITLDEMHAYEVMAEQLGVKIIIIVATGDYESIHDVPDERMQSMRDRWEA